MNNLNLFYQNEALREEVKAFFIDTLKVIAAELAFEGKSTSGIIEAKDTIERSFDRLEEAYGKKEKPIIHNSR